MMCPERDDAQYVGEIQPLHKVLPAGGPLITPQWTCPVCGLTIIGVCPRSCMDDRPDCVVGAAS
jgi:rubrerythrin